MVQCEMCGTETGSPRTAKIEGAELQVCASCVDFGTEIDESDASSTSSKYSTQSSDGNTTSGGSTTSKSTGTGSARSTGGSSRRRDLFDEMDPLAGDYPERIRSSREDLGLSQEELANELNEKASLIRKLERGDMQPNDSIQAKLENKLGISLTEGASAEDADWESDVGAGKTTLGDLVRRKD